MPLISQVHVNKALTNLTLARPAQNFIAGELFPTLQVQKQSDTYFIHDSDQDFKRLSDDARRPGAAANEVDDDLTTATYFTGGHALKKIVTNEEEANADTALRPKADATTYLVEKVSVNKEVAAHTALNAALTGNQTAAASNGWNDYTDGDPIGDILTGIEAVEDNGGVRPNKIAMDSKVWHDVRHHPDIVERVISGGGVTNENPANISLNAFAGLFDLEMAVVTNAIKNTAIEGQSASSSRIWSDDVYIVWADPNPGIKTFTNAVSFTWLGAAGTANNGFRVREWFDEEREGTMVQVQAYYDLKVVAATAGYRISNVIQ